MSKKSVVEENVVVVVEENAVVLELKAKIKELEEKLAVKNAVSAKDTVGDKILALYEANGPMTLTFIAEALGIKNTNVSSVISRELKKNRGYSKYTDQYNRIVLIAPTPSK